MTSGQQRCQRLPRREVPALARQGVPGGAPAVSRRRTTSLHRLTDNSDQSFQVSNILRCRVGCTQIRHCL